MDLQPPIQNAGPKLPEVNPEKIEQILKEIAAIFYEKQCHPGEMGIIALYTLQIMQQFAAEHKVPMPSGMTMRSSTGYEMSYKLHKLNYEGDQSGLAPKTPGGLL